VHSKNSDKKSNILNERKKYSLSQLLLDLIVVAELGCCGGTHVIMIDYHNVSGRPVSFPFPTHFCLNQIFAAKINPIIDHDQELHIAG
jgi:hypothetical protein